MYDFVVASSLCARAHPIAPVPSSQIWNQLTLGPNQVKEMDDAEFSGPLRITQVLWYFDTHLHHLKLTPGFTAAFPFMDHRPELAFKIACTFLVCPQTVPRIGSTECRIS